MKTKWLINPFERIAGWQALSIGLVVIFFTALAGSCNNIYFNGVLDIRPYHHSFVEALLNQIVNITTISLAMWLGALLSRSLSIRTGRFIDVAGTLALSRVPYLFFALLSFIPAFVTGFTYQVIAWAVAALLSIWAVALMYQACRVSCGFKGNKGIIVFIISLIVSEAISLIINQIIMKKFIAMALIASASMSAAPAQDVQKNLRQTTDKVIEAFQKNDYKSVVSYFDDTMKKGMTEEQLKAVWEQQIIGSVGKFVKAEADITTSSQGGYDILLIPCIFEKAKLNIQLAFNKKGQISGLFFKP